MTRRPILVALACLLLNTGFGESTARAQSAGGPSITEAKANVPRAPRNRYKSVRPTDLAAAPRNQLDQLVDHAIEATRHRMLTAEWPDQYKRRYQSHTPWQIAHGILGLRHDYEIMVEGQRVNAIEWVATNPTFDGEKWFVKTRWGGKGQPFTVPYAFEGHPNQFLAFFATVGLPLDFRIGEGPDSFTLQEWVDNARKEVNTREEITWTLWAFAVYLEPDARWVDQYNRGWSMEKLIRMQMEKHPTKSACGGMHGLFAIAEALKAKRRTGEPLRGVWLEADMHVKRFVAEIKSMQNRDGSFSSNYLKGPQWTKDVDKRVSTTGHTLEFLMNALPDSELNAPWVQRAVEKLSKDLYQYRSVQMEPGGMYHAVDALVIYRERTRPAFRTPHPVPPPVAEAPRKTAQAKPVETKPVEKEPKPVVARPEPKPQPVSPEPKAVEPKRVADNRPEATNKPEPARLPPPPAEVRPIPAPKPVETTPAGSRSDETKPRKTSEEPQQFPALPKPVRNVIEDDPVEAVEPEFELPVPEVPEKPEPKTAEAKPTRPRIVLPAPRLLTGDSKVQTASSNAPKPSVPMPVTDDGDAKRTDDAPEDAESPELVIEESEDE